MSTTRSAREEAARHLARRALTRRELADRLARAGHGVEEAREAIAAMADLGAIDDLRIAYERIVGAGRTRRRSRARLEAELERRGIDRSVVEAAWSRAVDEGEAGEDESLAAEVARRLASLGTLDRRGFARVYNALLRDGFDPEAVEATMAPHRALLDGPVEAHAERDDDDLR